MLSDTINSTDGYFSKFFYKKVFSLTVTTITLAFFFQSTHSQNINWEKDSLRVDSIYNVAKSHSNINPVRAGTELEKLITLIDDTLLYSYPSKHYIKSKKAISQHFLAYFKRRENKFDKSLKLLLSSIKLKKEIGDTLTIPKSLNQLGKLWMYQEDFKHAENYLLEALEMSKAYETTSETLSILSNLGICYQYQKKYPQAEQRHKEALKLAESTGKKQDIASSYVNYAAFLTKQKKISESLPYIKQSVELHRELDNIIGLESGFFLLGHAYHRLKQYKTAIKYYKQSLELSEKIKNSAIIHSRHLGISKSYEAIGNNKKALEYYKKYYKSILERKDLRAVKKMSDLESKLKYEKQWAIDSLRLKVEENKKVAKLKTKNRTTTLIFVSVFSVLSIVILIIYIVYKERALNAERIAHQNAIKNLELKEEISEKNKRVSSLLAESITHLNEKEKITQNLKKISNNEEDKVLLKAILRELNVEKLEDTRALIIKKDIEKLNDGFLQKIQQKHPDLTKTELEISLLLVLGLSRKDIAKLRGTTENAVKTSRKRIRKKLDIDRCINLEEYLKKI